MNNQYCYLFYLKANSCHNCQLLYDMAFEENDVMKTENIKKL